MEGVNMQIGKRVEHRTFIETFFDFHDACTWVDHHLDDHDKNEWHLEQCSINLINGGYRAGVVFSKLQPEFDI
jgi:hypothetical protein